MCQTQYTIRTNPPPRSARTAEEGMLISSGIMFLMYRFNRLVALVYIRQRCSIGVGQSEESEFLEGVL